MILNDVIDLAEEFNLSKPRKSSSRINNLHWSTEIHGGEIQVSVNRNNDIYIGLFYDAEICGDLEQDFEARLGDVSKETVHAYLTELFAKAKENAALTEAAAEEEGSVY